MTTTLAPPPPEEDLVDGHDPMTKRIPRATASYRPRYQRFLDPPKKAAGGFDRQYSHLYMRRMQRLRPKIMAIARSRWCDDEARLGRRTRFMDMIIGPENTAKTFYCFTGTVYKQMKQKPCILDEIDPDPCVRVVEKEGANFATTNDTVLLEDSSGRIELEMEPDAVADLVTGVLCAVRGLLLDDGRLKVLPGADGICFAGLQKQPVMPSLADRQGKHVLLLSGIRMGDNERSDLAVRMMLDFVTGHLGTQQDSARAAQIVRVVVAGDSVVGTHVNAGGRASGGGKRGGGGGATTDANNSTDSKESQKIRSQSAKKIRPVIAADGILAELASSLPVDVMPGAKDPTNFVLPQQPLHPCLFPCSTRYKTMRAVTNPYHCEVGGISFLGSSGQPVRDVLRYRLPLSERADRKSGEGQGEGDGGDKMDVDADATVSGATSAGSTCAGGNVAAGGASTKTPSEPLRVMKDMLMWAHMAPTAPDTLGCYPFEDKDPFLLSQSPHVFFCGNAPAFDTSLVRGKVGSKGCILESTGAGVNEAEVDVRVVCVPNFRETSTAVLLSLDTLECTPLTFGFMD